MRKNAMVKCAVIGCGRIGSEFEFILDTLKPHSHAGSYRQYPKSKLCLGVDSSSDKAESFINSWSVPCYKSITEIPSDLKGLEGVECVSICTPPSSHLPVIVDCINNFKNLKVIWCEKPLGTSLDSVIEIRNRCREAGVRLCVNTWRRWDPIHRKIEDLIKSGKIGKIQNIYAQAHVGLSNTGIHLFDLINQYTGATPVSVSGKIVHDGSVDPGAVGVISYDSGFSVFVDNLWKKEQRLGMIIQGEGGRIEAFANKTLLDHFTVFTGGKSKVFRRNSTESPMYKAAENIERSIREDTGIISNLDSIYKSMMIVAAFYESHDTGKPVDFPVSDQYHIKKFSSRLTSLTKDGSVK